jgi:hypothetical protein
VPLTEEEENWVRLSMLLVEEGTLWVSKIIEDYVAANKDIDSLKILLDSNSRTLTSGKGKKKLTPEQKKVVFPVDGQEPDIKTFDLTLLIQLIRMLLMVTPNGGWDVPELKEHQKDKGTDVLRMRHMRNSMYAHITKCVIPTPEFDEKWELLVQILVRLGAPDERELNKIKKRQIDNKQRKTYAQKIAKLFRSDVMDSDEFAKAKMEQINENHKLTGHFEPGIHPSPTNIVDAELNGGDRETNKRYTYMGDDEHLPCFN